METIGGTLIIEDGIFVGNISAVYVHEGKAEIKGGKAFMSTYGIKQTFEVKSHAELENIIQAIAKKCVVNPSNVDFEIIN